MMIDDKEKLNFKKETMIKNGIFLMLALMTVMTLNISCQEKQKQQNVNWLKIDDEIIQNYLAEHNIDATKPSSGIYYRITGEGNGKHPNSSSIVRVNYKGYLTDGSVFDESNSIEFPLSGVIDGWKIGIPLIDKGGSGQLFIPSPYGYGFQARPGIPSNSVLIFEVDLLDFH